MYVYIKSEPRLWTVGFYDPQGEWQPESDHGDSESAARRVAWLNGQRSSFEPTEAEIQEALRFGKEF